MFIANVEMDLISFQGIPLYHDMQSIVFASEIPFHLDGIVQSGKLLSVPKNKIVRYTPASKIHMLEQFSILHLLDDQQKTLWKQTMENMFRNRGASIRSFLTKLEIEELLVLLDLWDAGDLWIEYDTISHYSEEWGIVAIRMNVEEDRNELKTLLRTLVMETKRREQNRERTYRGLRERFRLLS